MKKLALSVKQVEEAFGARAGEWVGECHAVATAIVESGLVPNGRTRYGHWLGPVSKGTYFGHRQIIQHGWIDLRQGKKLVIIDPTRWVFEGQMPYIFIGEDPYEYYDIGGSKLRAEMVGKPPKQGSPLPTNKIRGDTVEFMCDLIGHNELSVEGVLWLANQPPNIFKSEAKNVYLAIAKLGLSALIPLDHRNLVMKV